MTEPIPITAPNGNAAGTFLKTWFATFVLGGPLGLFLWTWISVLGVFIGLGFAVWVSGKAFGLQGRVAHAVVFGASVVSVFGLAVTFVAFAISRMGY
jgi:hypothetical protein